MNHIQEENFAALIHIRFYKNILTGQIGMLALAVPEKLKYTIWKDEKKLKRCMCGKDTHQILCLIYAPNIVEHVPFTYTLFMYIVEHVPLNQYRKYSYHICPI